MLQNYKVCSFSFVSQYIRIDQAFCESLLLFNLGRYNAFNVYRRELAPGTVILTGDRAQGDDSKHWAYSSR